MFSHRLGVVRARNSVCANCARVTCVRIFCHFFCVPRLFIAQNNYIRMCFSHFFLFFLFCFVALKVVTFYFTESERARVFKVFRTSLTRIGFRVLRMFASDNQFYIFVANKKNLRRKQRLRFRSAGCWWLSKDLIAAIRK